MLEKEYYFGNATGDTKINTKSLLEQFDRYTIKLILDEDNKFVRVDEVAINKDFLESKHKNSRAYDYSEYYQD